MLAAQLGVRVMLLVGDTVPLPPPHAVTTALAAAQVTTGGEDGDGFQLTFAAPRDGVMDYSIIKTLAPFKRVVVSAVFGVVPEVLIDGVITHQQFTPSEEPGGTTLTVSGRDLSQMLDLEEKNEAFPNQPDSVIAMRVLASYARYGILPRTTPTTAVPVMLQLIPRQAETDLAFLRRMARRNGFVFYVEPVAPGVSQAYWGPENRAGMPQPALTLGMGAESNVRGLHFTQDALAPVGAEGSILEPTLGVTLPIPPLPSLKLPPLALSPLPAERTRLMRETANASPTRAAAAMLAASSAAPDAVTAEGELDTARYGHALRARALVGVRGVGASYDGLWYVRSVTHDIRPGDYRQRFALSREGTMTTLPALPT
ncbi:MAG TPA: hypothetical protein VFQ45_08800 [Longimicrobium sp.]|nr:hypothetical protein [Longimicrobium sp.]